MKCPFTKVECVDILWKIAWGGCVYCDQAASFRDAHPRKIEPPIDFEQAMKELYGVKFVDAEVEA